ncbi:FGGY family carbohydrate kinase [uncultured Microbacterium sp.]|uniref:FGGY-family carbohydrate kinase n=1 Tax=uncultured Microbacterium sp. TaxID=191216 RepID=UPI0025CCE7A5|nr:FGGY family carbohydrate kinase [uncultured Microbacterium sp.]
MTPTITVDIGTTSIKLCVFDGDGALVVSRRVATPTVGDGIGEVYDVAALLDAVRDFVADLEPALRRAVQRIALAGVGESGGLVGADLSLRSPMILWHDQRGAALLRDFTPVQRERVYAVTGLPVNANYALSKVAWALAHAEGDTADALWLNVSEFVAALLTGRRWSEPSLASRTMALDLRERRTSREVCALLGVDPAIFPPLRPAALGVAMDPAIAHTWGLDEVTVHVAGHDHMVGGVGADLQPGEMLDSTGTTEGILTLVREPRTDAATAATKIAGGLACDGESFTLFASIPTGGSAFATVRTLLDRDEAEVRALIDRAHRAYLDGKIDLGRVPLVLPRFRGSPPPDKDASDRGAIAGVGTDTTAVELVFGCFLGLARQFADVWALFGADLDRVKVIGPAASNPLWLQLKADLLGAPVSAAGVDEIVSRGAQALAHGARRPWENALPREIAPDPRRHRMLQDGVAATAARWEHLKAMPA